MALEYQFFTQFCGDPSELVGQFTDFEILESAFATTPVCLGGHQFVEVYSVDGERKNFVKRLTSKDDFDDHRTLLERKAAWKPFPVSTTIKTPVTRPNYYKEYVPTMEWLEAMQYIPSFREPIAFIGGVEMLARKYLDRRGGKDPDLQEVMKALWYFKFMAAYMRAGRPIKISEIDDLLKDPL